MGNATANRRINLYINGKEVKNDIASIKKEMYKLVNEQSRMTRGSKEYVAHTRKIRGLKKIISDHNTSLRNTGSSWSNLTRKVRNGMTTFLAIGAAIGGAIAMLWKFINAANKFEKSLSSLSSLTGLVGDDLKWLGDEAKKLSVTTTEEGIKITKSATEILEAFKLMGSAKPELLKSKEALAEVTKEALILAEAADMETAPAVESLANTMNQFNAPADQARRYINALAAGSKAGAAAIPDVAAAVKNFGAVAANANLSIEQSVGLIETLAEKGVKGAESGVKLRNFLLTLQQGADDTNPAVVGLSTALENFAKKGYSTVELTRMFGKENVLTAQILSDSTEKVEEYTKAVTGTNTAYEQAIINTDNTTASLDQAKNQMQLMSIALGEKLQPALLFSTNKMTDMLKVLMSLMDWTKKHSKTLKIFGKILLVVTSAILANKAAFLAVNLATRGYNQLTKIATIFTKGFNAALKLSPLGMIVPLLSAVITALWLFKDNTKEATDEYGEFNEELERTERIVNREKIMQFLRDIGVLQKELKEISPGVFIESEKIDASIESINKLRDAMKKLTAPELKGLKNIITDEIIEMKRDLEGVDLSGMLMGDLANKAGELSTLQNSLKLINKELEYIATLSPDKKRKGVVDPEAEQKAAYEKLQASIKKIREQMHLDTLDADAKELAALEQKYDKLWTQAEGDAKAQNEITELYYQERNLLIQKQEEKHLKAKQEAQQKLEEFYLEEFDKEKKAKIKQYQDLITLAEEHGLMTTEAYKKLVKDLEAIKAEEETDIFGMSPEDWETFQENFEEALGHIDDLASAYDAFADLQSQAAEKELNAEQKKADRKKEILKKQLDQGLLDQKTYDKKILALDDEMEKKRAEFDVANAKREKISGLFSVATDTARGIMGAIAMSPGPVGFAWSALIAAQGILQAAAIMSQPLPEYAGGGFTDGDRVYRAGEKGTEWIAPNKMMDDPYTGPVISHLEHIRKGLMPSSSISQVPDFTSLYSVSKSPAFAGSSSTGSQPQEYPSGQGSDNNIQVLVDEIREMKEDNKRLIEFFEDPANRRAYISYDLMKDYEKEISELQNLGRIS
ncbi:MAG: phage tail tape measure protein [Bacteroidales bacterium]|nr:phage tail tape measure protein [Bacteroidales bacterium]